MRLVPAFPFFVINVVFGLTNMRALTFYWMSALGMLPGTILYVWAGAQLATVTSVQDIVSPQVIGAFVLLGVFPLIVKKGWEIFSRAKNQEREYAEKIFPTLF